MTQRIAVPTDPAALDGFINDFTARYGVPPIAGGETVTGDPGQQGAPPAAPAAQPATAVPPAVVPGVPAGNPQATQVPGHVDPAAAGQGQPPAAGDPAAAQGAPQPPDWAQTLLERMDEIAPPQAGPSDPLAAELFGFDPAAAAAAQQPQPGQPGYDPNLAAQAAGLGQQPGAVPQLPGQPQAMPGQPPQQPGQPMSELDAVRKLIRDEALAVARDEIRGEVQPYIQAQDQQRRRQEAIALTEDYPEFRDTAYANSIVTRAKQWGQQILGRVDVAGEPGFLELVHLASKQLDAARKEGGVPGQQPGQGEVPIEQPGGANPGATQTQPDQLAQRIVAASPSRGLSQIWT